MNKIKVFLLGTIVLSLATLIPLYYNFQKIADKIEEIGISNVFPNFWQGFALIAFVVAVAIGILMALIVFEGGEKYVV